MSKKYYLTASLCLIFVAFIALSAFSQPIRNWMRNRFADRVRTRNESFNIDSKLHQMTHDGRIRSYYVYKPTQWNKTDKIPLVFLFHGGGGNARSSLYFYQLEETAEKHGFLLVSPNGTGATDVLLTWNVFFGFGYAHDNNVDDIGFINALIDKLEEQYPIDPDRIFATGLSNGAIFCHFLAAQPDNRLAAIAPVVGTLGGTCLKTEEMIVPPAPSTAVSVCIINGFKDKSVPIYGGLQQKSVQEPRILKSASDTIDFWVKANNCAPHLKHRYDSQLKADIYTYPKGEKGAKVKAYIISNNGHAWPGSPKATHRGADIPAAQFNANEIIWDFFKCH